MGVFFCLLGGEMWLELKSLLPKMSGSGGIELLILACH